MIKLYFNLELIQSNFFCTTLNKELLYIHCIGLTCENADLFLGSEPRRLFEAVFVVKKTM